MTAKTRQQVKILAVALVVLAVTAAINFRGAPPASVAAVQPAKQQASVLHPTAGDARIRIDLIEKPFEGDDAGEKNLFQYRSRLVLNPGPPPPRNPFPEPVETVNRPPPPPPPPPPIPFKYEGYAARTGRGLTAFLTDSTSHYNVSVGEVLLGRYRILSITESDVEVEDLNLNRRQSLPRVQP